MRIGHTLRTAWAALDRVGSRLGGPIPLVALLAAVAGSIYGGLVLHGGWYANFDRGAIFLMAGLAALVVYARTAQPVTAAKPRTSRLQALTTYRWEAVFFLGVVVIAAFMRSFRFSDFPPHDGLWLVEENNNGGNAYAALEFGERRLDYAATHLLSTLGLAAFGYNATALRLPFLIFSIISLLPFYLALRELVSARAALAGLALYAVARWAIFSSRVADDPWLVPSLEIWLFYFMLRAAKHGTVGSFLGLGVTSAMISYEYMGYRHLPVMALGLLALVWGWRLLLRARTARLQPLEIARLAAAASWRQVLVLVVAFYIVIAPMALSPRGSDFYLEPYHRQSSDREAAGVTGLLPGDWQDRLKWGVEVFAPFAPQDFPDAYDQNVPGLRYFDPVTSFLFALAFLYALFRPRDPYRVFFVAYFGVTLIVGSVFPLHFVVYRFTTLIPVVFVLIAILAHDADAVWDRRMRGRVRWLPAVVLVGLVAFAGVWNGRAFFGKFVPNAQVQAVYYDRHFAFCNYARDLGSGVSVQAYSQDSPLDFVFVQRSDYAWVCSKVPGGPVPDPDGFLPLQVSPGGTAGAAVYFAPTYPLSSLTAFVKAAYPSVTEPSAVLRTPDGSIAVVWYVVSAGEVASRQGLVRLPGGESNAGAVDQVVDAFPDATWPATTSPHELRWAGLLRADGAQQLLIESGTPTVVSLDGRVVSSTVPEIVADGGALVDAGWHWITIEAQPAPGPGSLSLRWRAEDGTTAVPAAQDFLALPEPVGLVHQSRLRDGNGEFTVWGLAPYPSFTAVPVLVQEAQRDPAAPNPELVEQVWSGTWDVASSGDYSLDLAARGGRAQLFLDGQVVANADSPGDDLVRQSEEITLEAGPHHLELIHHYVGGAMAGAFVYVGRPGASELTAPGPFRAY